MIAPTYNPITQESKAGGAYIQKILGYAETLYWKKRKKGRRGGKKEGRKGGRKEGRKEEGRKERRKEGGRRKETNSITIPGGVSKTTRRSKHLS